MEMDHGIKEDNHGNAARIESSEKLAILGNSDFCASQTECRPLKECRPLTRIERSGRFSCCSSSRPLFNSSSKRSMPETLQASLSHTICTLKVIWLPVGASHQSSNFLKESRKITSFYLGKSPKNPKFSAKKRLLFQLNSLFKS